MEINATTISKKRRVAQRYICDEMTFDGRKFDFRVFWMVASVDPLIVLYHTRHNYVRIGHAKYDESNFNNTKSHLTTHTFGADEKKATWDEFKVYIEEFQALHGSRLAHLSNDPFAHVQNQIKQALATLVDVYRNVTFHSRDFASQNAFSLHAADMIIDNDLDVFLIEGTDGPGKDEDYDFRIAMHNSIFGSLVDIFEEVTSMQVQGIPLDVEEMKRTGILGDYEVIYNQNWLYKYTEYDRLRVSDKRGCRSDKENAPAKVSMERVAARANTTAAPKQIAAMGFDSDFVPSKLFYMEGRTNKKGEMVTRSFRRNGWVPVDLIEMAQIVYDHKQPTEAVDDDQVVGQPRDRQLESWQFYNRLPISVAQRLHDWSNLQRYVDSSKRRGSVCRPLQFRGRDFKIHVYMLVVSLDPLIVYYHDGYLDIPYSKSDENEFLTESEMAGTSGGLFWRGSWKSLEVMLAAYARTSAKLSLGVSDPYIHVRNQFKHAVARAANGLAPDLLQLLTEYENSPEKPTLPNFYGIYRASFQLDGNLNAFLSDLDSWNLAYGESYQDIVNLHDDLFGAAFNLLEAVNKTINEATLHQTFMTSETLEGAIKESLGGYELVVHNLASTNGTRNETDGGHWMFEYVAGGNAADCS